MDKEIVQEGESRRDFLSTLWMILAGLGLVEFSLLIGRFLGSKRAGAESSDNTEWMAAGLVNDFVPGSVTAFPVGKFYLVRLEDGGFLGLSRQCTHLGCTVPWVEDQKKFICPCHASSFDLRGEVLSAPAPRPLDVHPVEIENNTVKVNVGNKIKRGQFRKEHVVYPKASG